MVLPAGIAGVAFYGVDASVFHLFHSTRLSKQYQDQYACAFADKILKAARQLSSFPESGILKREMLMSKYGFRALFIDQYVLIYKIQGETVYIYHLKDARKDYIHQIFGLEP